MNHHQTVSLIISIRTSHISNVQRLFFSRYLEKNFQLISRNLLWLGLEGPHHYLP